MWGSPTPGIICPCAEEGAPEVISTAACLKREKGLVEEAGFPPVFSGAPPPTSAVVAVLLREVKGRKETMVTGGDGGLLKAKKMKAKRERERKVGDDSTRRRDQKSRRKKKKSTTDEIYLHSQRAPNSSAARLHIARYSEEPSLLSDRGERIKKREEN